MTNHARATEAADAENWLAAIAFAVLAVVDEFRLPDPNALDEIRTVVTNWATQDTDYDEDTEQQIDDGRAILDILTRHGLNEGNA